MLTRQMWLVAHLSDMQAVERVEAVVGDSGMMYIADHPKRCIVRGIDVHETFAAARDASVRYLEAKIQHLVALRDTARSQRDPTAVGVA